MENEKDPALIYEVISQLFEDMVSNEYEAVEELLSFIPVKNLIAYLPESKHEQFKHLLHERK